MSDVQRHYDELLAAHYAWMGGMAFSDKAHEQQALLRDLGFPTESRRLAVDLGCGPGYQAVALRDLGYERVIAVDTSQALLDDLTAADAGPSVEAVLGDIRNLPSLVHEQSADTVVCMGDTLTHLESRADVSDMLHDTYRALRPDGRLALTFRDYSVALTGTDRFIPVRSDDQRIMLCALLYEPEHVLVNDLVHLRSEEGWSLHKSSYRKLRLPPSWVVQELQRLGFSIEVDAVKGRMHAIVARRT